MGQKNSKGSWTVEQSSSGKSSRSQRRSVRDSGEVASANGVTVTSPDTRSSYQADGEAPTIQETSAETNISSTEQGETSSLTPQEASDKPNGDIDNAVNGADCVEETALSAEIPEKNIDGEDLKVEEQCVPSEECSSNLQTDTVSSTIDPPLHTDENTTDSLTEQNNNQSEQAADVSTSESDVKVERAENADSKVSIFQTADGYEHTEPDDKPVDQSESTAVSPPPETPTFNFCDVSSEGLTTTKSYENHESGNPASHTDSDAQVDSSNNTENEHTVSSNNPSYQELVDSILQEAATEKAQNIISKQEKSDSFKQSNDLNDSSKTNGSGSAELAEAATPL